MSETNTTMEPVAVPARANPLRAKDADVPCAACRANPRSLINGSWIFSRHTRDDR